MSGYCILEKDVRLGVTVVISVTADTFGEAVEIAKIPVAKTCSDKLGYAVKPGVPLLDDWYVLVPGTFLLEYVYQEKMVGRKT
jgi:hypothetical protein